MQNGIAGTAKRQIHANSIFKSRPGHNLTRSNLLVDQVANALTTGKSDASLQRGNRHCCATPHQAHAEGFRKDCHGVGSKKALTGTGSRTSIVFAGHQLLFIHNTGFVLSHGFKGIGDEREFASLATGTSHHRPGSYNNSGNIKPQTPHNHSGSNFVTIS